MTEQLDFKPGDLVKLRSGGPVMAVDGKDHSSGNVLCSWFDDKKRKQDTFTPAVLAAYVPAKRESRTVSEGFRVSRS